MTAENCLRLMKFCLDNNDVEGAAMYKERAERKTAKKLRLKAIQEAQIKKLLEDEENRLQELEREVGIRPKETKPKEVKKDGKTTKRSGN